jgi:hypothetical protein
VDAGHQVRPCFFIPGAADAEVRDRDLAAALNLDDMRLLRDSIRRGERSECATCVCPLWRDAARVQRLALPVREGAR